MRIIHFIIAVCRLLASSYATAPSAARSQATSMTMPTPLILEENQGERRVLWGWPRRSDPRLTFVLKVDAKKGGSSHLVFGTEAPPPR
jgi:hypothetical protein